MSSQPTSPSLSEGGADRELDGRWLRGEPGALAEAYGRYRIRLEGVAFRILSNHADAEDVVQRIFVGLPRAAYRGTASLWTYLYRATVNGSINLLRSRKLRDQGNKRLLSQHLLEQSSARDGPEAQVLNAEMQAVAARALGQIKKPQHRRALVLRVIHGLTNTEIAEQLGVPLATVGTWLRRGREEYAQAVAPLLEEIGRNHP